MSYTKVDDANFLVKALYEVELLEFLCVFDKEQDRLGQVFMHKRVALRTFLLSLLIPIAPFWFAFYPAQEFLVYFTNWGLLMTILSLTLSALMPYDILYRSKPNKMALHHLMLSMSLTSEIVICSIYWTMLHKSVMKKNAHSFEQ